MMDERTARIHEMAQKMYPNEDFNKGLDISYRLASEGFDEDGLIPKIVMVNPKVSEDELPGFSVGILDPSAMEDRYGLFRMLGARMADEKEQLVGVFFLSEAWSAVYRGDDAMGDARRMPPVDREDRQEIVCVFGMTLDRRCNRAHCEIIREGDGVRLGEPVFEYYREGSESIRSDLLNCFFMSYLRRSAGL